MKENNESVVAYFVRECPAWQEFVRFNEIKVRK